MMRKRWSRENNDVLTKDDTEESNNTLWLDDSLSARYKSRHTAPSDDFSDYDAFRPLIQTCD